MKRQDLRVLYVEDNPFDTELITQELARAEARIDLEVVATVAAATARLERSAPPLDIVLTDFYLPDGTGLELLAHIRERGLPLAVVVITGSGDPETAVTILKAGADDYLVKNPRNFEALPWLLGDARDRFRAGCERRSRSLRVLYAEPNRCDVDRIRHTLTLHAPHIHLDVIDSGAGILARLPLTAEEPPAYDAVMLDYRLPGLNALEVTKILRQERRLKIPLVLVTGQGDEDVAVQALRMGVDDYLVKREGYLQKLPILLENVRAQAALAQTEARYRNLFASMRDAIIITDLSRTVVDANQPALRTIFGYETDEICGRSSRVLYADDTQFDRFDREVSDCREGGSGKLLEARFRRKSGEVFVGELLAMKMLNDTGDCWGIIGVVRDITERHRAEQERRQLIDELEKRNAELERFTYTVSHDLKGPLLTILGFIGQLRQDLADGDGENVKADLAFIRQAAGQMKELLDSLLQLSRAGRTIGDPQPVDLTELARQVAEQVGSQYPLIEVQLSTPAALPAVMGDPLRLREVFQNLLENAAKFTAGQSEPCLHVGYATGTDELTCFVRDNGIGIPAEYLERIFGLFEKLDPGSEGTGVGLAIVRRIVEEHRGKVWAESRGVGQGSTFYFTLPT